MKEYLDLYRQLDLPPLAISLAAGESSLYYYSPPCWGGFAPALLPLASTESGTARGYWKHWFVEGRTQTIVSYEGQTTLGRSMMVTELARTFDQFLYLELLNELACNGELSDGAKRLARTAQLTHIDWLIEMAEEQGDNNEALLELDCFRNNPPQSCFEDLTGYTGDFPKEGMEAEPGLLRRACGYEVHSRYGNGLPDPRRYRERIAGLPSSPPWLKANDKPTVFRQCLNDGDLGGAWLCLNSPGWTFDAARDAIQQLSLRAGNSDFSRLAEAWCGLPHESRMIRPALDFSRGPVAFY